MTLKRYSGTPLINGGAAYGTSYIIPVLRTNISNGNIGVLERVVTQEKQRLDVLAGQYYGDGSLWWLLAASSGIGWGPQVPAGTIVLIPNLADVTRYIGN